MIRISQPPTEREINYPKMDMSWLIMDICMHGTHDAGIIFKVFQRRKENLSATNREEMLQKCKMIV